ncbi:MAG: hypothetical protein AYK18_08905 [Theionarchaea archaeon DG-70]|nr:MAG: hypothetical protein AYK18_08905 [Theionarchaea archaeon DG-70]
MEEIDLAESDRVTLGIISIAERLLLLERSDFDVSTGLLIKYNRHHVFVIHNPDRWVVNGNKKEAGVVGVGGKLEQGETVLECVKRECKEEINCDVEILDSEVTYVVTSEYVNKFTLEEAEKPRPYYIILLKVKEQDRRSYTVVFSYEGEIYGQPEPKDVSAVLLAQDSALRYLRSLPTTVKFMKEHSAQIVERIHLPDDLYLRPCGTLLTYLRLKYWQKVNDIDI